MQRFIQLLCIGALALSAQPLLAQDAASTQKLEQALKELREDYDKRIRALEAELAKQKKQSDAVKAQANNTARFSAPSMNPKISVILDGHYAKTTNEKDPELSGYALAGEAAHGVQRGFNIGHSELSMSANVDDKFYGKLTTALAEHDGETQIELEEAFLQTLGFKSLPGLSVRAGRFLPSVGQMNLVHEHAWDFADAPLIYDGLWGKKYIDDGIRLSWVAPTETFVEVGAEALAGKNYPAGGERFKDIGSQVYFINVGRDFGTDHSALLTATHQIADVKQRKAGGHHHHHEGEEAGTETHAHSSVFSGDSKTLGLGVTYKWAPNGNFKQRNIKLQTEWFKRQEDGLVEIPSESESSTVDSTQQGFYVQGIYQFHPQWRTGLRYDRIQSTHKGSDPEVLSEVGLDSEGIKPERVSAMLEWLPSEFSRIRLQYNDVKASENNDEQVILQYTMSLGDHAAHTY